MFSNTTNTKRQLKESSPAITTGNQAPIITEPPLRDELNLTMVQAEEVPNHAGATLQPHPAGVLTPELLHSNPLTLGGAPQRAVPDEVFYNSSNQKAAMLKDQQ